jgi:hypothetical protein
MVVPESLSLKPRLREERHFGMIVGGVLTLLGLWWLYRGKLAGIAPWFVVTGSVLILLGAFFPKGLVAPNKGWMALASVLSQVSTAIILSLVYFLAVTPIGLIKRLRGWDPLHRRSKAQGSYWMDYTGRQWDRRHYEKMF